MDIEKKILSDPLNKWIFNNSGHGTYLVGGYIRDLLLGIKKQQPDYKAKDRDFAVKSNFKAKNIAVMTAKKFNGTFIILKPGQTYRVVLKNKVGSTRFRETLDFSPFNKSVNNDLSRRDFTINAMAWSPETGIVDTFGGRKDLAGCTLKAVRMKNLTADPLRIIRAFRIAAELGFEIDKLTKKNLKKHSGKLAKVAPERITDEFFKLLSQDNAIEYLDKCCKDSVLKKILSPNDCIKTIDTFSRKINILNKFDLFLKIQLKEIEKTNEGKRIAGFLKQEISQGLNRIGLIRLALLTIDIPICDSILRLSRDIHSSLRDIHSGYRAALHKIPYTKLYKIFNASGERYFEIGILLSFIRRKNISNIFNRANEYLKIKNKILLNGNDVQDILQIKPGAKVGIILSQLKDQQFKGLVRNRVQARKWLLCNFT
jgi:tRNA nucleotidyltransferase/poly(A) polymerase